MKHFSFNALNLALCICFGCSGNEFRLSQRSVTFQEKIEQPTPPNPAQPLPSVYVATPGANGHTVTAIAGRHERGRDVGQPDANLSVGRDAARDATRQDAGHANAGSDSGSADAGQRRQDAGQRERDAGLRDAGRDAQVRKQDSGRPDARYDAGRMTDAGRDTGQRDASRADAGQRDAGGPVGPCPGGRQLNACGHCDSLPDRFGAECGCGGQVGCQGQCENEQPLNACGLCGPMPEQFGFECGCSGRIGCSGACEEENRPLNFDEPCGCDGRIGCDGRCDRENSHERRGEPCGCQGTIGCLGNCENEQPLNACGQCGALPDNYNEPCGCNNTGRIGCSGNCENEQFNLCGQCGPMPERFGEVCGCNNTGRINCAGACENESRPVRFGDQCGCQGTIGCSGNCENEQPLNVCGQCGALPDNYNEPCGCQGRVGCQDQCENEQPLNACGQCGALPDNYNEPCGCNNTGRINCARVCANERFNSCGQCAPEPQEICNQQDDNCNGQTDERLAGCCGNQLCTADETCGICPQDCLPQGMVHVANASGSVQFCIDAYEASRQDATAQNAGVDNTSPPLSRPGVLPWGNAGLGRASSYCRNAGKILCTPAQWEMACRGANNLLFPYGNAYVGAVCNDNVSGVGGLAPTGSFPNCVSSFGAFDMSGNGFEAVDGMSPSDCSSGPCPQVRGGSWENGAPGSAFILSCEFVGQAPDSASVNNPIATFRCCKN